MNVVTYNCPCCGAPLAFSGASGKLECAACGNSYDADAIESLSPAQDSGTVSFELPGETFDTQHDTGIQAYICKSCGAELMTSYTTTATECPYCGSPTILPDRLDGSVKPALVIPFAITKEQAQKQFEDYFKGKRLLPNIFLNGRNRISEMRMLYVPYWLFDCAADANIVYDAQKDETHREGEWEVTRTKHYIVRRKGGMIFDGIPVDGSEKLDNKITESIEPYDMSAAVPFSPAVLAGALADHADVNADECEARAVERVKNSVSQAMRNTVSGYTRVSERYSSISTVGGKVTPVLMPVWLITTEKEGKTYTFAINGQTGKLTCDVPADKKKSLVWGAGIFTGTFGVAALAMWLLKCLGSGTLLIAAIMAAVLALAVVGVMLTKLKRAVYRNEAAEYVREGSFALDIRYDNYLYETVKRRKIESNNK